MKVLDLLLANMGITLEQYLLLATALGSLMFMAKDLRLGCLILFFMVGIEFLVLYASGRNYHYHLLVLLLCVVLLTVNLLISYSKKTNMVV